MRQQSTVTTWAKKNFMLWFMENYPLRNNGARRILTYLLEKKPALSFLHIIENGSLFRPLLVISSENTGMPSCLLITVRDSLYNSDAILEYLENFEANDGNRLFLTFYFPDREKCRPFWQVSEEGALIIPPDRIKDLQFKFELRLLLEEERKKLRRQELMAEIDQALAKGERLVFQQLARELKNL
ncbi:MAG: IDEAL domain-containing protein [Clostridia bacterium]|nr:IDEAL domain-containing protein [Clostridia bacterium]